MNVLVAYATRAGSTVEVANHIGQALEKEGFTVSVRLTSEVTHLSPYDAVVVGSAIRVGRWLPEAVNFVKKFRHELEQKPVAFFTVCMTLSDDTPENRELVWHYLDPVREILQPQAEGFFAGAYDPKNVSFITRMLLSVMQVPSGDYRDFKAITTWAKSLESVLE